MGQAQPNESGVVVEVEEFEPLFEPLLSTPPTTPQDTPTNTHTAAVTVTATPTGWTLKTASEKLGLSMNTIRKRIKDRELRGFKVIGPNGPEWRITPPTGAPTTTSSITPQEPGTVTSTTTVEALLKVIETQAKQIDAASDQVRAASEVIMYQRSQLEERDSTIKLLTDSQHRPSWWHKFNSWCIFS